MIVYLDAGPLGMVTNPFGAAKCSACNEWMATLLARGDRVIVPEICDYEVRRELLRAGKTEGVRRLDCLKAAVGFAPITTDAMLKAAELWAQARQAHRPTAHEKALDGDVILCAQAVLEAQKGADVIIATDNVGHLSRFTKAALWRNI